MSTQQFLEKEYKYGFATTIETEHFPPGLTEETVRALSAKKEEPPFLLEFRLKAFRGWLSMEPPKWANLHIPPLDYQRISYYSAPKKKQSIQKLEELDPELLKTFDRLGIPPFPVWGSPAYQFCTVA